MTTPAAYEKPDFSRRIWDSAMNETGANLQPFSVVAVCYDPISRMFVLSAPAIDSGATGLAFVDSTGSSIDTPASVTYPGPPNWARYRVGQQPSSSSDSSGSSSSGPPECGSFLGPVAGSYELVPGRRGFIAVGPPVADDGDASGSTIDEAGLILVMPEYGVGGGGRKKRLKLITCMSQTTFTPDDSSSSDSGPPLGRTAFTGTPSAALLDELRRRGVLPDGGS